MENLSKGVDFLVKSDAPISIVDLVTNNRIELQLQKPMDLSVIWTDPPRSMVCLEPWTGPRQALIKDERVLKLKPGSFQKLTCRFVVS